MAKYLVRQRRPMWVCLIQEVEAASEDEAINKFYDEFNPSHTVLEGQVQGLDLGPVKVFDAAHFPDPQDVADED